MLKIFARFIPVLTVLLLCDCSGIVPNFTKGRLVSTHYLAQFRGGGSLSTLWYLGSDEKYHHFAHFVKINTYYKVRRQELRVPQEFSYKSRDPLLVGNAPNWRGL
jgi:hypothetical protein